MTTLKKGRDISAVTAGAKGRSRLLILAYHAIADLSDDKVLAEYAVPGQLFDAQLTALAADGWEFVSYEAALAARRGGEEQPPRALLISFDDAYADLLETACPILERHRAPAIVFVIADQIGGSNYWDSRKGAAELALLGADGLREVAARGVEVGSHSSSHRALPTIPEGEVAAELGGSADRIEAAGLARPRAFSYPYGRWTPALAAAVREAGYANAFTTAWGAWGPEADPFAVPRIEVHASDSPQKLKLKLAAATWPGRLRDGYLWARGVRLDPSAR